MATASDAEYFWTDGSLQPIARRGNVVVLRLLGSPTTAEKKSIRAALEALPDSGHLVRFVND
ncbi:MAG: hypothetical protein M3364_09840 [Actinomycetota bacterium]|nr:hypothetical protein [Actinomycetota bacterium]